MVEQLTRKRVDGCVLEACRSLSTYIKDAAFFVGDTEVSLRLGVVPFLRVVSATGAGPSRPTRKGGSMNQARRQQVDKAIELLQEVREAEQEARDNVPENLDGSAMAEGMDEAIDGLDEALDVLETMRDFA